MLLYNTVLGSFTRRIETMDIKQIESFFFEAMKSGWAQPVPKIPLPEPFSGGKAIPYRREINDGLYLLDYYFVAPDSKSSYGTTVIWIEQRPAWVMHYGGWYEKGVISFLKRALARNYNEDRFMGGRGPEGLEGEDHTLQYLNRVEQNDFSNFRGHEWIEATSPHSGFAPGTKLGEHHYFGGVL